MAQKLAGKIEIITNLINRKIITIEQAREIFFNPFNFNGSILNYYEIKILEVND